MALRFGWDPRKAVAIKRRHGVTFEEAATAFGDDLSLTVADPEHSVG
ncbi:MAG: BrnT family toxin [Burkholderiales bacterium]